MDVLPIPSRGFEYTWSNKREANNRTYTKIDHMFGNEEWNNNFPNYQLDYEAPTISDHSPGILSIKMTKNFGPKPFKFIKAWMSHPKFKEILEDNWAIPILGNPQLRLAKKLKRLKVPLKKLNTSFFTNISVRVHNARQELEIAQQNAMEDSSNPLAIQSEENALQEYIKLSTFEESFYKEKSRIKWMKEGDKNTQFFHRTVKAHTARNKILRLQKSDDTWTQDCDEVKNLAVNFFESLFTEPNPDLPISLNWNGSSLTDAQANGLLTRVTQKEIRDTLFSIKNDSAPGPDGYTVEFFKSNWDLVGNEFTESITYFFPMNTFTS